jgi:hypothetical protein
MPDDGGADNGDHVRSRTREEKLEALAQRESVSERTRELAKRVLRRIREERQGDDGA